MLGEVRLGPGRGRGRGQIVVVGDDEALLGRRAGPRVPDVEKTIVVFRRRERALLEIQPAKPRREIFYSICCLPQHQQTQTARSDVRVRSDLSFYSGPYQRYYFNVATSDLWCVSDTPPVTYARKGHTLFF